MILANDVAKRQSQQIVYKKDKNGKIIRRNGKPVVDKNFGRIIHVRVRKRKPEYVRKSFKVDKDEKVQH